MPPMYIVIVEILVDYLSACTVQTRPGNSGGTWEPSSQKIFELVEIFGIFTAVCPEFIIYPFSKLTGSVCVFFLSK